MRGVIGMMAMACVLAFGSVAEARVFRQRVVVRQPVVVAPRVQRVVVPQAIIAPSVLVPQQQIFVPQRQTIILGW